MFQVFLSYASEDLAFAEALADALESEGLRTFLAPRGVSGGSDWRVRLRDELDHCNACIAVLTDAFRRSRWCDQEVGYAMGSGRPVIPVRPASTDPAPYGLLGSIQAVPFDGLPAAQRATAVFDALLGRHETHQHLVEVAVAGLGVEREIGAVRKWVDRLERLRGALSPMQRSQLKEILRRNATIVLDLDIRSRLTEMLE